MFASKAGAYPSEGQSVPKWDIFQELNSQVVGDFDIEFFIFCHCQVQNFLILNQSEIIKSKSEKRKQKWNQSIIPREIV